MPTYPRLNFLQNALKQFPDDPEIHRAYREEQQAVLEDEMQQANAIANEPLWKSVGRTALASAVEAAPIIGAAALAPETGGLSLAGGALLGADILTGASQSAGQYIRGQEPTGQTLGGAAHGLGSMFLLGSPHPLAQLLGAGLVGSGMVGRYQGAQQELQNIGADAGPLNTLYQATLGPAYPGELSGGAPVQSVIDAHMLAQAPRKVAESPVTTGFVRRNFSPEGTLRNDVIPAVLQSGIGKTIFGKNALRMPYEQISEPMNVPVDVTEVGGEGIVPEAKWTPVTDKATLAGMAATRSTGQTFEGKVAIDPGWINELWQRRIPIDVIVNAETGETRTVDPRSFSRKQFFDFVKGHEVTHLRGQANEIAANIGGQQAAMGLKNLFRTRKPVTESLNPIEQAQMMQEAPAPVAKPPIPEEFNPLETAQMMQEIGPGALARMAHQTDLLRREQAARAYGSGEGVNPVEAMQTIQMMEQVQGKPEFAKITPVPQEGKSGFGRIFRSGGELGSRVVPTVQLTEEQMRPAGQEPITPFKLPGRQGEKSIFRMAIKEDNPPKKTVKAYKLFRVDERYPGKLFPLFVGANDPVEIGEWYKAEVGEMKDGKVKSKIGPLAMRPGWHAGDLPIATHIGGKSQGAGQIKPDIRPENQVWAEVELPADVDWQSEANKRGTNKLGKIIAPKAHITDQVPAGGHYRYKTNPNMTGEWLIGGSMKVNRILSDAEVSDLNAKAGTADLPRQTPFNAEKYGFGKKPQFMAVKGEKAPEREAPGWFRAAQEGIASITDSTYRNVTTWLDNVIKSAGDVKVDTSVRKNKRGKEVPPTVKSISSIRDELQQATGEAKINHAEMMSVASKTGYDQLRSVIANDALPADHPFRTSAPELIQTLNEQGPAAVAQKFGLSQTEVQALTAARDFMSGIREFSVSKGYMGEAPDVSNYVKQVPKELAKLVGQELPSGDMDRGYILNAVLGKDLGISGGNLGQKYAGLIDKIQQVRADMIGEIERQFREAGAKPEKATRAAAKYTEEYLKGQIMRDLPFKEGLKRVVSGFMMKRSIPGLGQFQESDFSRLLPIVEAEYAKFAEFPKAKWAMDNIVRGKWKGSMDKKIRNRVVRELVDYYAPQTSVQYEPMGWLAETSNRWFGTNFRNAAEATQGVIGFLTKNLIATPKFLFSMNPFDPVFRAAQNARTPEEATLMLQVMKRYATGKIPERAKSLIREGNLLRSESQWKAGDKGTFPEFIQKWFGPTAYETIGKIYNAIPNAVERQEVGNNRMIFLWNLERNLRGKVPAVEGMLNIDRLDSLPKDAVETATKQAMADTYEQQGRIGGLFGKSALGAEIGRGGGFGRASYDNIAFMFARMFSNYPISTVNNMMRTMRQIMESGDPKKVSAIQPAVLLAAAGAATYGLPTYISNVAKGKDDAFVNAMVEGVTREFRMPTTTFIGRIGEDIGRTGVAIAKGNLKSAAFNAENLLSPTLPGYTVGKQLYGLGNLIRGKKK